MSTAKAASGAYKSGAAARITGVSRHTIDFWARTQTLAPSIADCAGTGTDRLYSYEDLRILLVLGQAERLPLEARRKIVRAIRDDGGSAFIRVRLSDLLELVICRRELDRQLAEALYGK